MSADPVRHSRVDVALRNAARAKQGTIDKLLGALRVIEAEMLANSGIYAANPRGLTRAEVARRAGITDVTLAKKRHQETREWIDEKIAELRKGKPRGKKETRRTYAERIAELEADSRALKTQMIIHELERAKAEARAVELEAESVKQREELAKLKRQTVKVIGTKVER